jgi:riboflavin kinase/FMN adenylyltransferase
MIDGQNVSSTKIRQQLQSGNIETASSFLGRYYSIDGVVVKGNGWGREFGFPTANIHTPHNKLIPIDGIYAGRVEVDGKSFNGAISIGTRPTVTDSDQRVLEAHLLDFNGDLYGMIIRVHLHKYIRPQIKFSSKAALIEAIHHDIENIQEVLA